MNRIPDKPGIKRHGLMAVERFADDTRHMAEFDVLSRKSPLGERGDAMRLFLSDEGYTQVLDAQRRGDIRIRRHARVIEGHILPEKPPEKPQDDPEQECACGRRERQQQDPLFHQAEPDAMYVKNLPCQFRRHRSEW